MNKKIKVIDIFNKIEKHEDIPKNIKFQDCEYVFKHTNYSIDHLYELKEGYDKTYIGWLEKQDINLFDEVEILEDNTEEIAELDEWVTRRDGEVTQQEGKRLEMCYKINELTKAVNKLKKEQK